MNLCDNCAKRFRSVSAFDRHRTGEYAKSCQRNGTRRCMTAEEMQAKGMVQNARGAWMAAPREGGYQRPEQLVMKGLAS